MKKIIFLTAIAAITLTSCHNSNSPKVELNNMTDSISWVIGEEFANSVANNDIGLNKEVMVEAFRHTLNGGESQINENDYKKVLEYIYSLSANGQGVAQESDMKTMTSNEKEAFAQLESNPNIKKTAEGFYYEIVRAGKGSTANYGDRVLFDYRGYNMLTGKVTDQTYGNREPILHVIGEPMFQGLIYGMQLMNTGSIFRFYFPSQLAFGKNGSQNIPADTPVIYEIELHEIYND